MHPLHLPRCRRLLLPIVLLLTVPPAAYGVCPDPQEPAPIERCAAGVGEGLRGVALGERWGFVDARGRLAIAPRFDGAGVFAGGRAPARSGDLWGYVDARGRWLIEPRFVYALSFSEGRAFVGLSGGELAAIDLEGRVLARFGTEWEPHLPYRHGRAVLLRREPERLLSARGETVLPVGSFALGPPSDGRIPALRLWNSPGVRSGEVYAGYLDEQGVWAIEPRFDWVTPFLDGYAAVKLKGEWSLIDRAGRVLKTLDAQDVSAEDGIWTLKSEGRPVRYLRPDGTPLPDPAVIEALPEAVRAEYRISALVAAPGGPLALLRPKAEGGAHGFVRADGRAVFDPAWLEFGDYDTSPAEWPLVVRTRTGYGAVDADGRWVVPPRMRALGLFRDGAAEFVQYEAHGVATRDGELLFAPEGRRWHAVVDRRIAVFSAGDERYGLMDVRTRQVLAPAQYDALEPGAEPITPRAERLLLFRQGERRGVMDGQGRILLPARCDSVQEVVSGGWLCNDTDGEADARLFVDERGVVTPVQQLLTKAPQASLLATDGRSGAILDGGHIRWLERTGRLGVPVFDTYHALSEQPRAYVHTPHSHYRWVDPGGGVMRELEAYEVERDADGKTELILRERELLRFADGRREALHHGPYKLLRPFEPTVFYDGEQTRVLGRKPRQLRRLWRPLSARWLAYAASEKPFGLLDLVTGEEREVAADSLDDGGEGLLRAQSPEDGRWGYLDELLRQVIAPRYRAVGSFENGAAWVAADNELQLIDRRGRVLGRAARRCGQAVWVNARGRVEWPAGFRCGTDPG